MPYTHEWVPPELFMEYHGVKVFRTYADNEIVNGINVYWYTLHENEEGTDFDVRDLSTWKPIPVDTMHKIKQAIRDAIDSGELKK